MIPSLCHRTIREPEGELADFDHGVQITETLALRMLDIRDAKEGLSSNSSRFGKVLWSSWRTFGRAEDIAEILTRRRSQSQSEHVAKCRRHDGGRQRVYGRRSVPIKLDDKNVRHPLLFSAVISFPTEGFRPCIRRESYLSLHAYARRLVSLRWPHVFLLFKN